MNKNKTKSNYFYVNRSLLHSDRWLSEPFTRGQAWVDLFGLAQHRRGYFRVRGIRVEVERGQLAYSQITLAKRWQWSRNKVRRYLKELEKDGDVKQQNNEVTTIITILKYNDWQGDDIANKTTNDTANDTTEGQQKDSRRYTYNNDKNDNNEKNLKEIDKEIFYFLKDKDFTKAFNDYLDMRKNKKPPKPATNRAKELVLTKLHKHDIETAIIMLEKAITGSWTDVWELNGGYNKPQQPKENKPDYLMHKLGEKNDN